MQPGLVPGRTYVSEGSFPDENATRAAKRQADEGGPNTLSRSMKAV